MADRITLQVVRYRPEKETEPTFQEYEVPCPKEWVVLDGLNYIKDQLDGTLSFRWSCRMGVCGSCGMMVNGEPKLTCAAFLKNYYPKTIRVEPLANFPVIGTQISRNVHALDGNGVVLTVGIALTLWSGLGVVKATQAALNTVWNVPRSREIGCAPCLQAQIGSRVGERLFFMFILQRELTVQVEPVGVRQWLRCGILANHRKRSGKLRGGHILHRGPIFFR